MSTDRIPERRVDRERPAKAKIDCGAYKLTAKGWVRTDGKRHVDYVLFAA